jgi:hypothetical protein
MANGVITAQYIGTGSLVATTQDGIKTAALFVTVVA